MGVNREKAILLAVDMQKKESEASGTHGFRTTAYNFAERVLDLEAALSYVQRWIQETGIDEEVHPSVNHKIREALVTQ